MQAYFQIKHVYREEYCKMTYKTLQELSINPKGEYGIGASSCSFNPNYPQYIRITDITDDCRYLPQPAVSINPLVYPNYNEYYLKENDIVFARTGASTGRNYFYNPKDGNLVFAGFLIKFSINPNLVHPRYVKYFCQSKEYNKWIASFSTGSTRGNLNAQSYGKMQIPIKSEDEQQHIVDTMC